MPSPSPSGTAIFTCPLSRCAWTYTSPPVGTGELLALTAIFGKVAADESVIAAHLSTHGLVEWVTEVVNLHGVMTQVAAELDERGRIGHSLLTGAMATGANLARKECIEWLGRAIKGDPDD